MNIYFCGIGGVGLGPLAEIAVDAGHHVEGSDREESLATKELENKVQHIVYNQDGTNLAAAHELRGPIDWFVYSSGIPDDNPEMAKARELGLKMTKRDELLNEIVRQSGQKLIAVAGTHGKTTTTGMLVWAFTQKGIPVSWSVGSQLSFGPSGKFEPDAEYFIYECDEFDRNFLHFQPSVSLITAVDYDHPDTYPTKEDYDAAFDQFMKQSDLVICWNKDASLDGLDNGTVVHMMDQDTTDVGIIGLPGLHNRQNAYLVYAMFVDHFGAKGNEQEVISLLSSFPGTARRFEKIADNMYSDYGHHPVEIKATLQLASELSDEVVLVYQPHQNVRQHEIRNQYTADVFQEAYEIYWLPTYLTREDPTLPVLSPETLAKDVIAKKPVYFADLNDELWQDVQRARDRGALVLFMGAGTIDAWIRGKLAG